MISTSFGPFVSSTRLRRHSRFRRPVQLKRRGLRTLDIVVDANQDLQSRWQAICHRLARAGYDNLPVQPDACGFIVSPPNRPRIGV